MWRTIYRAGGQFTARTAGLQLQLPDAVLIEKIKLAPAPGFVMPRRRLPHIYPDGGWLFVTWHLQGSLPRALYPPPTQPSAKAFAWMDRYLDTTRHGPMFLRNPEVARLVVEQLERGREMERYDLHAFVVMANHVHILFRPREKASAVLQWLKGTTARKANQALARTDKPFWQRESYDHYVRDGQQFERIAAYIENNPVKAGLVSEPSQYPWSSARTNAANFSGQ